jgi:membrane associated rhomboid family serine protease
MKQTSKHIGEAIKYALILLVVLWVVHIINFLSGYSLVGFGILPRTVAGLKGIIFSPFIHGSFQHLIANTWPLGILSAVLFFFYKKKSAAIFILIWLTAGFITWLIGRASWHIGASTIIYALASFLFFGGLFSRRVMLILVSIIIGIAYYGLIWGIIPSGERISWEGHLAGAISGFTWAYYFRNSLRKQNR